MRTWLVVVLAVLTAPALAQAPVVSVKAIQTQHGALSGTGDTTVTVLIPAATTAGDVVVLIGDAWGGSAAGWYETGTHSNLQMPASEARFVPHYNPQDRRLFLRSPLVWHVGASDSRAPVLLTAHHASSHGTSKTQEARPVGQASAPRRRSSGGN